MLRNKQKLLEEHRNAPNCIGTGREKLIFKILILFIITYIFLNCSELCNLDNHVKESDANNQDAEGVKQLAHPERLVSSKILMEEMGGPTGLLDAL